MLITEIIGKISRSELRDKMRAGVDDSHENLSALLRQIRQNWDKHRYDEIFGPNKYRLTFPIQLDMDLEVNAAQKPEQAVVSWLSARGYTISDYNKGLAVDDDGKEIRIGKIINRAKNDEMKHLFDTDPARVGTQARKKKYYVVISRSPTDIIQMSTGVGWTSCMNLVTGAQRKYVPLDVKYGTLIAFLVREGDTKLQSPVSRLLIKPYVSATDGKIALGVANEMYNLKQIPEFQEAVTDWADQINSGNNLQGDFTLTPGLYSDNDGDVDDDSIFLSPEGKRAYKPLHDMSNQQLKSLIIKLKKPIWDEVVHEVAIRDDDVLFQVAFDNISNYPPGKLWPEFTEIAITRPKLAAMYAIAYGQRWVAGEPVIMKDTRIANIYFSSAFDGYTRWPEFEEKILKSFRTNTPDDHINAWNIYRRQLKTTFLPNADTITRYIESGGDLEQVTPQYIASIE